MKAGLRTRWRIYFINSTVVEDNFANTKSHLKMLVQLARADGAVVQEEIDGRLYKEEIKHHTKIAGKLGYEKDGLMDMMLNICSGPHISTDKESLKAKIQAYLKR